MLSWISINYISYIIKNGVINGWLKTEEPQQNQPPPFEIQGLSLAGGASVLNYFIRYIWTLEFTNISGDKIISSDEIET